MRDYYDISNLSDFNKIRFLLPAKDEMSFSELDRLILKLLDIYCEYEIDKRIIIKNILNTLEERKRYE